MTCKPSTTPPPATRHFSCWCFLLLCCRSYTRSIVAFGEPGPRNELSFQQCSAAPTEEKTHLSWRGDISSRCRIHRRARHHDSVRPVRIREDDHLAVHRRPPQARGG